MTSSNSETRPGVSQPAVLLFAAAVCTAFVVGPRGPVYWDSFGYVRDAITGHLSGLGAGRPWFSIVGHGVVRAMTAFGVSVWRAEPVLRNVWTVVSALAAPAAYGLARACGLRERAAWLAGIAMACSPAMAHTSRAVLSDGPSVAVTLMALLAAVRASSEGDDRERGAGGDTRRAVTYGVVASLLLTLAIGLREQSAVAIVSFVWLALRAPKPTRWHAGLAMAATLIAGLALTTWLALRVEPQWLAHIEGWRVAMRHERASHHYALRDLMQYVAWLVALGPLTLVSALAAWWLARDELFARRSALAAVCVPALAQLLLLAGYQDIAYSPRYLLPALAGALALPAGVALDRWLDARTPNRPGEMQRATALVLAGLVIPAALAAPVLRNRERPLRAVLEALPVQLAALPDDAVIVTGQPCNAVHLQRTLHNLTEPRRREWLAVCPGWGWPRDLDAYLEQVRRQTPRVRTVVLDLRSDAWIGAGQQQSRGEALAYARAHADRVAGGEVIVWW